MKVTRNSLRNQQEGMGHVFMVILVLVVLAVIGLIGYKVAGGNKKASTTTTTTTANTETSAANSGCVATYKDENLCKAAANNNLDKLSYKGTIVTTGADGQSTTLTMLSDGKGNSSSSGDLGGLALNTVTYAGHYYLQTDGTWYDYGTNSGAAPTGTDDPANDAKITLGSGETYKPLGKEACGTSSCFKYQVIDATSPGAQQFVWFDTNNYRVRQWTGVDTDGSKLSMTINYQSVSISKPSPAQPFSALGQ